MPKKERADQLVYEAGLAESREQAKRMIMAAQVYWLRGDAPEPVDKPGHKFDMDTRFEVRGRERFVSRGAYKLLTAIEFFGLDTTNALHGVVALDAGASTGGFTDCLLQHGAARVYAVDVGHGQLHERLRTDERVINLERTNLRTAPENLIPEPVDIIVADVSFISLTLVLAPCMRWLASGGLVIALVKPQFEVGAHQTDKGVVRDEKLQQAAVEKVLLHCHETLGLEHLGTVPSAIKGPKGNQEYLVCLKKK